MLPAPNARSNIKHKIKGNAAIEVVLKLTSMLDFKYMIQETFTLSKSIKVNFPRIKLRDLIVSSQGQKRTRVEHTRVYGDDLKTLPERINAI